MLHDLNAYVVGRLLLAALLGGAVGFERELRHKPAGLRTNMLICVGAALFTVISYQMASTVGGDHTRIAAQIIPGIGFIGAGVVIRERGAILGITSASTIFVIASVGMACGAGMPVTAIFTTMLLLSALVVLGFAEDRLGLHTRLMTFRVTALGAPNTIQQVHQIIRDLGIETRSWESRKTDDGLVVEFDAEVTNPQERDLAQRLGAAHAHCEARSLR
ncbi:MAG TPA: MgtC/SapB family protein [Candidatus Baltobacteraceae bacterium]|nr:MgtC/SapB family protein [Candidatus Baltobacteraceae bacterium]